MPLEAKPSAEPKANKKPSGGGHAGTIGIAAVAIVAAGAALYFTGAFGRTLSDKSADRAMVERAYADKSVAELKSTVKTLELVLQTGTMDESTKRKQQEQIDTMKRIIAEKESAPTG